MTMQAQPKKFVVIAALILVTISISWWFYPQMISGQTIQNQLFNFDKTTAQTDSEPLNDKKHSIAAVREQAINLQITANDLQKLEVISFPLLDQLNHEAVREQANGLEVRSANDVTWRGRLAGEPSSSVTLTLKNNVMSGLIFASAGVYEIIPKKDGRHVLVEINQDLYPDCGGEVTIAETVEQVSLGKARTINDTMIQADSGDTIDVLVVYTDDARSAAGGTANIETTVQQAIAVTNTAYQNSGVTQRVRLVHTSEVSYNEGGNASADLSWVRNNAAIQALRDQYKADLVGMVVNASNACGIGYLMTNVSNSFAPNGYTVTARGCAVGNLLFAHELGHNMGAAHNPENAGSAAYSYSYGHFVNGVFRTVMSYSNPCPAGCTRVPYFSNPNVFYNGYATGIAGQRDNASTLNNTDTTVANFRTGPVNTIPIGRTVALRAVVNNRYVSAEDAGSGSLTANREAIGLWEQFVVEDAGGGEIALRAVGNGKYVVAENSGNNSLGVNRDAVGLWERFRWIELGSGRIALQATVNNRYVAAENAGNSPLIANRQAVDLWETFVFEVLP